MGTNYYAREAACESCGRYENLHIGKSSGGWCFSLHVIPERGLNTLDDWKSLLTKESLPVFDEYERSVTFSQLIDVITKRSCGDALNCPTGYSSWDHFHSSNFSQEGPFGLLRAQVDGVHCVGHGEGTWDYIPGEFS